MKAKTGNPSFNVGLGYGIYRRLTIKSCWNLQFRAEKAGVVELKKSNSWYNGRGLCRENREGDFEATRVLSNVRLGFLREGYGRRWSGCTLLTTKGTKPAVRKALIKYNVTRQGPPRRGPTEAKENIKEQKTKKYPPCENTTQRGQEGGKKTRGIPNPQRKRCQSLNGGKRQPKD